jgi:methionyl-tRNA synthetase
MPVACEKIRKYLNIENASWEYIEAKKGLKLENIEPLFTRIEKSTK